MNRLVDEPWFLWALAVAVCLPLGLLVLTEIRNSLARRGSVLTRPVELLRNYILPLGALLVLLIGANQISTTATPVRAVATVFGFVVLLLLLSGLKATLFQGAPEGSWRKRIPSIFLDVARFVVIAIGLAMILSVVWGANVGGLFTALGVSSIVLGLALQNSVGQIISGLFLLFEQPFRLGDWIDTPSARGRVVEVNWRATHIDTGSGMQIMPNSVLAAASFNNLSRPTGSHSVTVTIGFSTSDPPEAVCAVLAQVAADLPHLRPGASPTVTVVGNSKYAVTIGLRSPADDAAAQSVFLRWIWYASRRAGLHLDNADDHFSTPELVEAHLRSIAPTLRLSGLDQELLAPKVQLARYGADETIQIPGQVPKQMMFVIGGRVQMTITDDTGSVIPVRLLHGGDFLGQTTLTREPVVAGAYAIDEVTVLQISRQHVEELVMQKPQLLQDIGKAIEERRSSVRKVLADASED